MRARIGWLPSVLLAHLASLREAFAADVDPEVDAALAAAAHGDAISVLLAFPEPELPAALPSDRPDRRRRLIAFLRDRAAAAQGETTRELSSPRWSGRVGDVKPLWITNALGVTADAGALHAIAALPGPFRVRLDHVVPQAGPAGASARRPGWSLDVIGAAALQSSGVLGRGATVAVLDSGVDAAHPGLRASYRGGLNGWYDPYGQHAAPFDATGHGTQMAGVVVGRDASGASPGVAPGARWIAAKIFDDKGAARYSAIHLAFQWVLDPDDDPSTDDAPDVVNGSWSLENVGTCNHEFHPDLLALRAAGIVPVFAAGTGGPGAGTSVSPANDPLALSVGATDEVDRIYPQGSRGPSACGGGLYPMLVAPGVSIRTTDLSLGGHLSYTTATGPSLSAAHVSGALALLVGAFPGAVEKAEHALLLAAADLGPAGPDDRHGHGRLDVRAAHTLLSADADMDGTPYAYDCDDAAPSIHPGAEETKNDGVDQDCDGYDLTIEILEASYDAPTGSLRVEATSALEALADLELVGFGPMTWDGPRSRWVLTVGGLSADPTLVSVIGLEGSESAPVTRRR